MTDNERIMELEHRVAVLETRKEEIDAQEQRVLRASRAWARMSEMCFRVDPKDGTVVSLSRWDADEMAEQYLIQLRHEAVELLRLEASR